VVIEATRWFKNGDHPDDACYYIDDKSPGRFLSEGKVVRYFRHPEVPDDRQCGQCLEPMVLHGWIDTLEAGHRVCPGDWIVQGIKGEYYSCKDEIFRLTYEEVNDAAMADGN